MLHNLIVVVCWFLILYGLFDYKSNVSLVGAIMSASILAFFAVIR